MPAQSPPSSLILGYVSSKDSPTRTRTIAALVTLLIGLFYLLPTAYAAHSVYTESRGRFEQWAYVFGGSPPPPPASSWLSSHSPFPAPPPPPPPTRTEVLKILLSDLIDNGLLFTLIPFTLAITAISISPSIRRGKRLPCLIMIVIVLPTFAIFMALGGLAAFFTMNVFVSVGDTRMPPIYLLLAIPAALAILSMCALIDLVGYLRWIARQSIGEKPPKKFI